MFSFCSWNYPSSIPALRRETASTLRCVRILLDQWPLPPSAEPCPREVCAFSPRGKRHLLETLGGHQNERLRVVPGAGRPRTSACRYPARPLRKIRCAHNQTARTGIATVRQQVYNWEGPVTGGYTHCYRPARCHSGVLFSFSLRALQSCELPVRSTRHFCRFLPVPDHCSRAAWTGGAALLLWTPPVRTRSIHSTLRQRTHPTSQIQVTVS
mmetsp:Transcript_4086/g.25713  ORF Transcript_4086/g.25713 Transcript_4086/m.25713 type:complete len:212 (+) Transcript_4086:1873-2508(+)